MIQDSNATGLSLLPTTTSIHRSWIDSIAIPRSYIVQPATLLLFIRHVPFKIKTRTKPSELPTSTQQDTRPFGSPLTCLSVLLLFIYLKHLLHLHNLQFTVAGQHRLKTHSSYPIPDISWPRPPSPDPFRRALFAKLFIMTPSSDARPKAHSPSGYLELLPATTYVIPKQKVATPSQSHLADQDFDIPVENETKTATTKWKSSSISTGLRAGSSMGGDRSSFLQLAAVPALNE